MNIFYPGLLAGLLTITTTVEAQSVFDRPLTEQYANIMEQGRARYQLELDNDSFLFNGSDKLYTSGITVAAERSSTQGKDKVMYGWHAGQEIFTGRFGKEATVSDRLRDRPFAGWLYAGLYKEVTEQNGASTSLGLDIGCLGPCAQGEAVQSGWHSIVGAPAKKGWSQQVGDTLGVILHTRVTGQPWHVTDLADVQPSVNIRVGNVFTDATIGLSFKTRPLWVSEHSVGHGFAQLKATAVGYNATLQGRLFDQDVHSVEPVRLVTESELGVHSDNGPWALRAAIVIRSNDNNRFRADEGRQHFARVSLSYTPEH